MLASGSFAEALGLSPITTTTKNKSKFCLVDYFLFLSQYVEQVDLKTLRLPWPPSPEITSTNHGQPSQHYQNGKVQGDHVTW